MRWSLHFSVLTLLAIEPALAIPTDIRITTPDCAQLPTSSEGDEFETVCGFSSVDMNAEGDRIVTVSISNNLQLWDREGNELLKTPVLGPFGLAGSSMIMGKQLLVIPTNGVLVRYDLRGGKEISRQQIDASIFAAARRIGSHHLLVYLPNTAAGTNNFGALDLESGMIVKTWTGLQHDFGLKAGWAIGTTQKEIELNTWQTTLHLNDESFTEVNVGTWCEPIDPEKWCISRDIEDASGISIYNVNTHTSAFHNFGIGMNEYTQIQWLQTGGKKWPMICTLPRPSENKSHQYGCSILEWPTNRVVYHFQAPTYRVSGGTSPDGNPEFRIAISDHSAAKSQVFRVSLNGKARRVGPASYSVALTSLFGDLLIGEEGGDPTSLAVADADGLTTAHLSSRFGNCTPMSLCAYSSDKSVVAVGEGSTTIRWYDIRQK